MPRKSKKDEIVETIGFTDLDLHELRAGIRLREKDLEKARDYLVAKELSTKEVDGLLETLRGKGPTRPGLKAKLGVRTEKDDPNQTDLEDEVEEDKGGAGGGTVAGEITH